jgi:hypothetical protein
VICRIEKARGMMLRAFFGTNLIPGSPYEARLQSRLGPSWGGYSALTMPEVQEINCGDPYTHPEQLSHELLEELKPYAEINAGGFPVTVLEATGSNGRFTGCGYVQMLMLGTEQTDITVDFEIPGEESIHKDEQGNIVVDIDDRQVVI